ncbi:MAG: DUF1015 domain-containing protein [Solirubrobacteraceae bacterium]
MAEVLPLKAVHYDLNAVPSLGDVVAPPYDVITPEMRAALLAGSPFNVVEIDLPEAPGGPDKYDYAAQTMESWTMEGILKADAEPAIWALEQDYTGPDGRSLTRRGILVKVRLAEYGQGAIRPHERTQPGPKEDRLRLTRATRHNLSPIFALHHGKTWDLLEGDVASAPWGEATDDDGTVHRVWKIADGEVAAAIGKRLADAELLIADGHHRYETALTYAREVGGEGPHQYVLMALVSLEDPGLTVFATHRLLSGLDSARQEALRETALELFDVHEVERDSLIPSPGDGPAAFGYMDSHHMAPRKLTLKDPAVLDDLLEGHSEPYRRLDAAALEAIVLRRALGRSTDDIAAKRGLAYQSSFEGAVAKLESKEADAAFFLRPTPVEQVQAVAAAGETMPPKSTYFFPKLLTGIVFNPLS